MGEDLQQLEVWEPFTDVAQLPWLRQLQTAGLKPSLMVWDLWDATKQFVESYTGAINNI